MHAIESRWNATHKLQLVNNEELEFLKLHPSPESTLINRHHRRVGVKWILRMAPI